MHIHTENRSSNFTPPVYLFGVSKDGYLSSEANGLLVDLSKYIV